jgi:hypothetical protein
MGFRCEISGKHIQGKPLRVIAQRREVSYPEFTINVQVMNDAGYKKTEKKVCNPGGSRGWEIVKEILVDPNTPESVLEKFLKKHYK